MVNVYTVWQEATLYVVVGKDDDNPDARPFIVLADEPQHSEAVQLRFTVEEAFRVGSALVTAARAVNAFKPSGVEG